MSYDQAGRVRGLPAEANTEILALLNLLVLFYGSVSDTHPFNVYSSDN